MSKYDNDSVTVYGGDWGERDESDPPAINVKCYRFGWDAHEGSIADQLRADHPGLPEADAERIGNMAWEETVQMFWDSDAPALAEQFLTPVFNPDRTDEVDYVIESAGRSGGWLIVRNLPPVPSWTPEQREAWHAFESAIDADVANLKRWDVIKERIADAGWVDDAFEARAATHVTLSPAEVDTILAALRNLTAPYTAAELEAIATEHGPRLDAEAIADLCERINSGGN